ncbi:hypothetical protein EV361DRAFT_89204 [Lentinula raphanica]|nr:hypothetical protein EV361DRAFT_89204 [Lentinula raphanica]
MPSLVRQNMSKMNPSTDSDPFKSKKMRRRLRLSCIECAKRRQRCDRAQPTCGLCRSRGVEHLCRWATVPFARPSPAKTPVILAEPSTADRLKIQQLSERIRFLERQLEHQRTTAQDTSYPAHAPGSKRPDWTYHSSIASSPVFSCTESTVLADQDGLVKCSPCSGNVSCPDTCTRMAQPLESQEGLLHSRMISVDPLIDYALPDSHSLFSIFMQSQPDRTVTMLLPALIQNLPSYQETECLISAFFACSNLTFGLPETWIRTLISRMWDFFRLPSGASLNTQLNPSWICLIHAILAYVPSNVLSVNSGHAFIECAMSALRLASDGMFHSRSEEGIILACLAVSLIGKKYTASGRLNDAWLLIGNWIRVAQSLNLHHEDGYYTCWSEEEQAVRKVAWDNLLIWDRFYSLLLSRPSMNSQRVPGPQPSTPLCTYKDVLYELSVLAEHINLAPCSGSQKSHEQRSQALEERLRHCLERTKSLEPIFEENDFIVGSSQKFTLLSWHLFLKMKLSERICTFHSAGTIDSISSQKVLLGVCIESMDLYCATYDEIGPLPWTSGFLAAHSQNTIVAHSPLFHSEHLLMLLEACVTLNLHIEQHPEFTYTTATRLEKVYDIFRLSSQLEQSRFMGTATSIATRGLMILRTMLGTGYAGAATDPITNWDDWTLSQFAVTVASNSSTWDLNTNNCD